MKHVGTHALIVGGGVAGLFAATVASRFFEHVTVLDRDSEPEWVQPRKAVPQGQQFHALLPGGLEAAERWFPGFVDDLVEAGSLPFELGRDFTAWTPQGRSYSNYGSVPEPHEAGRCYTQTRPLLEACIRRRVDAIANVTTRFGVLVRSPLVADRRVAGVILDDGSSISADLVIDASGRNAATAKWIAALGYGDVPESHIICGIHYATATVTPRN